MNTNKKAKIRSASTDPIRFLSLVLVLAAILSLASCSLFRKASVTSDVSDTEKIVQDSGNPADDSTGPADTDNGETASNSGLRYSEDDAYNALLQSFPPETGKDLIKIERTGNMIAENNGTEYYIFNVSLPIIPETTAPESDTSADEETDEAKETETTAAPVIEMAPPVPYYVSVNGVVHLEISLDNVDTDYARAAFKKNYGERDEATGYEYKLVYEELVKKNGQYCYSFAVYEINTSTGEPVDEYHFNYIVTTDGKLSATTVIDH